MTRQREPGGRPQPGTGGTRRRRHRHGPVLAREKVEALVTGNIGPNAARALAAAGRNTRLGGTQPKKRPAAESCRLRCCQA
ncbi:MAG TPA: hypothetical protein GXX50_12550 [Firmicutes bacterium]|nr:hypothetical protein [Bacillota bacterium]